MWICRQPSEVGCLGKDFDEALLNAMLSVGHHIPKGAVLVSSGDVRGKVDMLEACRLLSEDGYKDLRYGWNCQFPQSEWRRGSGSMLVPDEEGENVLDLISNHKVDLVINIPKNHTKREPY